MAAIGQTRPAPTTSIRTPLFIAGVALALIAFLVMFAFGLVYAGRIQAPGQLSVVVASRPIDARSTLDASMLKLASIPTSAVPPQAFAKEGDLIGYFALVPLLQGEPITANLVAASRDGVTIAEVSFLPIPGGMEATTIATTEHSDVAGYPAQGDYVNVQAEVPLRLFTPSDPREVAALVFTNLYIIRVGPQSAVARQGQPQGVASSVTVVMTQCDSLYLQWLEDNTTLKFSLISHDDYIKTAPPASSASAQTQQPCPAHIGPNEANNRWKFTAS